METQRTTALKVPEIGCEKCAAAIKRALGAVYGVTNVVVDVPSKVVTVHYDPSQVTDEALAATLDKIGFPVAPAQPLYAGQDLAGR